MMKTGSSDWEALAELLRQDLTAFVEMAFSTVSPNDRYLHNWHIEAIAYELERCFRSENDRLLITQPPRSLKSICSSVAFPAWALARNPKLRFICVSYSQDLALDLAQKFRMVVTSDWYRQMFPHVRLARDAAAECQTTAGGGRFATSVGGTLTGRGADIIIIDDPLKPEEAASQSAREAAKSWYSGTLSTRLNSPDKGSIILVMQRLHQDDLAGYVLAQERAWRHLDLPARAVDDELVRLGPGPADVHRRTLGELLHPERISAETLDRQMRELGSLAFSAQYQQRPVPPEGNVIRREWLRTYEDRPEGEGIKIVQSWDVAMTAMDTADWSVCTTWAVRGGDYHLIDVWRGRLEFPDLKTKVIGLQQKHRASTVLIEESGLGKPLLQQLRHESAAGFPRPIGRIPKLDKQARAEGESVHIENGHVLVPKEASWLASFLEEVLAFPNGKYDDQVDSMTQFLNWAWTRKHRGRISTVPPELIPLDDPPWLDAS